MRNNQRNASATIAPTTRRSHIPYAIIFVRRSKHRTNGGWMVGSYLLREVGPDGALTLARASSLGSTHSTGCERPNYAGQTGSSSAKRTEMPTFSALRVRLARCARLWARVFVGREARRRWRRQPSRPNGQRHWRVAQWQRCGARC
jgi:hypothetical protein